MIQRLSRIRSAALAMVVLVACTIAGCGALPANETTASSYQQLTSCPAGQTLFTAPATGDAQANEAAPTTTYPTNPAAGVGSTSPTRRLFFLGFNVGSIPAGATINSAELAVVQNPAVTSLAGTLDVYAVTSTWSEATLTWATQPTYGSSIASVATTGAMSAVSTFAIPPASIAALVTGPNYGFVINKQAGVTGNLTTREFGTTTKRPALTICYTPAPPVGCSDGVKNGTETDIDCGGSCSPCVNGKACLVGGDCLTSSECDPWDMKCHALGGASITPVATCTLPVQTAITPTTVAYGTDPAQVVDVYQSASPTGRCIVAIHGGGGTGGDKTDTLAVVPFAKMRAGTVGDSVFAINYRLATGTPPSAVNSFPAGLNDTRSFLIWLQANAVTYGCSPTRVAVVGFSMGSILAGQAATTLDLPVTGGVQLLPNGTALIDASAIAGTINRVVSYYLGSDFTLPSTDISATTLSNLPVYFNGATAGGPVYADGSPSKTIHPVATPFLVIAASGDPFLYPSQSAGTAVYPLSSGHFVLGYDPALRARSNASTFVGAATSYGTGHMFDPTAGGAYLSANCTADSFLNAM